MIEPWASQQNRLIRASVAADLVNSKLLPNRFAEFTAGVTVTVGGRLANGEVTAFFADDHRDPTSRRTYVADSAVIASDERGYVLQLKNGSIQYMAADKQFTEISFVRYDIALDRLTGPSDGGANATSNDTVSLVSAAMARGNLSDETLKLLIARLA